MRFACTEMLRAHVMAGGGDGQLSGDGCDASLGVDHRDLTDLALRIGVGQTLQRVGGGDARPHQFKSLWAVGRVDERLRRDGADSGFRPRHDGADREPMRLHGYTQVARHRVARDDRISVGEGAGLTCDFGGRWSRGGRRLGDDWDACNRGGHQHEESLSHHAPTMPHVEDLSPRWTVSRGQAFEKGHIYDASYLWVAGFVGADLAT